MLHYVINTAHAADRHLDVARSFVNKANEAIIFPLIALLLGVALLVFIYGVFEYIRGADDESVRSKGREHMIWGIVGLVIMVSAFAIIQIVLATFGLTLPR